jgi:hypothetical protein
VNSTQPDAGNTTRKKRWSVPTLAQIATVVGLIGGVVGLVFVFRPGWKPDAPVDVGKADITEVSVRQPVTFRRYLQRLKLAPGSLSAEQLNRLGVLIAFEAQISGFKGKELPLRWELNKHPGGELVAEDEAVSIVPSTNDEGRTWFVWAPTPRTDGRYYVTVTIYQPRQGGVDVPLEDFESPPFRGLPT